MQASRSARPLFLMSCGFYSTIGPHLLGQVVPSRTATAHLQVIVNTKLNQFAIGLAIANYTLGTEDAFMARTSERAAKKLL